MDETGLFWKLAPTRTIMDKTKGQAGGLKLQKSRFSVLFGGNASGDLKLKPLFIHTSENPRYALLQCFLPSEVLGLPFLVTTLKGANTKT